MSLKNRNDLLIDASSFAIQSFETKDSVRINDVAQLEGSLSLLEQ